jgi:hypothetical protein
MPRQTLQRVDKREFPFCEVCCHKVRTFSPQIGTNKNLFLERQIDSAIDNSPKQGLGGKCRGFGFLDSCDFISGALLGPAPGCLRWLGDQIEQNAFGVKLRPW